MRICISVCSLGCRSILARERLKETQSESGGLSIIAASVWLPPTRELPVAAPGQNCESVFPTQPEMHKHTPPQLIPVSFPLDSSWVVLLWTWTWQNIRLWSGSLITTMVPLPSSSSTTLKTRRCSSIRGENHKLIKAQSIPEFKDNTWDSKKDYPMVQRQLFLALFVMYCVLICLAFDFYWWNEHCNCEFWGVKCVDYNI